MRTRNGYTILLEGGGLAHFAERPGAGQIERLRDFMVRTASINPPRDDRKEIKDAPPAIGEIAKSVALVCDARRLIPQATGVWELDVVPSGLLSAQRFSQQVRAPGGFSGFLAAKKLLITETRAVEDLRVVFGFKVGSHGVAKTTFTSAEVFSVTEVEQRRDPGTREEWLLLQLDREPSGRPVLPLAGAVPLLGASLAMIGHPYGLPMKLVDNGTVTLANDPVFECDLDASQGNSGSLILDASSHVAGVMTQTADGVDEIAGVWLPCPPGMRCPTFVTARSTSFAAAVAAHAGP